MIRKNGFQTEISIVKYGKVEGKWGSPDKQ